MPIKISTSLLLILLVASCNSGNSNIQLGGSLGLTATDIQLDPSGATPLSAELTFTTPVPGVVRITVLGKDPDGIDISHEFDEEATNFKLPVLGLYPNYLNTVIVEFDGGAAGNTRDILEIATAAIAEAPQIEIIQNNLPPDDAGVYLFAPQNVAFDQRGEIRWLHNGEALHFFRKQDNGNWLASIATNQIRYHFASFAEFTMLGEKQREYPVDNYLHHEVRKLPWGNYLAAGNSSLIDFATNGVPEEDTVIEIDADTGAIVKTWDFNVILDPNRPTLPIDPPRPDDWLHINSAIYVEHDNSIVITGRSQSVTAKIDYDTGELRWILGAHELWPTELQDKLLTPVDSQGNEINPNTMDFWPYAQHAALVREPGYIAVYDNGFYRNWYGDNSVPEESYSRGVEYFVDENAMTVEIVWQYTADEIIYTPSTGDIAS